MIEETIRAVKDAESRTEQMITEAKAAAEQTVKDAETKAQELSEQAKELAAHRFRWIGGCVMFVLWVSDQSNTFLH